MRTEPRLLFKLVNTILKRLAPEDAQGPAKAESVV